MMVAFSAIKPGDVLWDCRRKKMGNTTMSELACWQVRIISVDQKNKIAVVSWNGNPPRNYREHHIKALRRTRVNLRRPAITPTSEAKP